MYLYIDGIDSPNFPCLTYIKLIIHNILVSNSLLGGQFCTDYVYLQQDGVYNIVNNRLAIIPNFNFTCNGTITNIRARVKFISLRTSYPFSKFGDGHQLAQQRIVKLVV